MIRFGRIGEKRLPMRLGNRAPCLTLWSTTPVVAARTHADDVRDHGQQRLDRPVRVLRISVADRRGCRAGGGSTTDPAKSCGKSGSRSGNAEPSSATSRRRPPWITGAGGRTQAAVLCQLQPAVARARPARRGTAALSDPLQARLRTPEARPSSGATTAARASAVMRPCRTLP